MEIGSVSGSRLDLDVSKMGKGIYICLLVNDQGEHLGNHKLIVE